MCVHHWVIDSNNQGKCKDCPEERSFSQPPIRLSRCERDAVRALCPTANGFYNQVNSLPHEVRKRLEEMR